MNLLNPVRGAFLLLALLSVGAPAGAQTTNYFFPDGQQFDPAIPSPEQFLGYEIGTHHTRHDRIVAYMQELARLSDRATYQEIGRTYELRPMPVLTVTAPANHARLDEIRRQHMMSTEPGTDPVPTAERKVIVHLGYGVHGNETSSSEAALLTAYWLVAGQTAEVGQFLSDGVYHVEPVLNPDGRDRHTHWANMHKSTPFVADPLDREHNEVWPGGRTNHYWYDLNRDWLPLENPESRARIDFHHAWRPNVVTDYHEMGANSTYFFEPSKPYRSWNPLLPERLYTDITLDFAAHWASALDEIGSLYFTKEVYDNMYPGYGSSYPNFLGGLGLVFEQASARGHIQESTRHGVLTFPFAIRNHVRTSIATVRAAVQYREKLLDYQRDFFASALREAERFPVKAYVFGDPHDNGRNRAFLDLLLRHRLDVYELPQAVRANGHNFEPGRAWVVPTLQPKFRMVRSIFERTSEYADSAFYDASTWTVSLAYGMPDAELTGRVPLGARVTEPPAPRGLGGVPVSSYAYLLDWSDYYAPKALYHLLSNGVRAEAAFEPFTARTHVGDREYARGSISIPVHAQNVEPQRLHELVLEAERLAGVPFQSTATGYSAGGADLGSGSFRPLDVPRILMVIGDGVSSAEAGQIWHMLDTKFAIPMTKIDSNDFGRADLSRYDVLVLPSGSYGFISGTRLDDVRRWVRGGGTLIALRTAAQWAVANDLAPNTKLSPAGDTIELGRRDYADAAAVRAAQAIGGSIWMTDLDITHPPAFGYQRRELPVWRDHSLFFAPSTNPYSTVARLTDEPHLSGYISARNLDRLRGSPSLLADQLGRGSVILMLDNPNFRGYWYGTNRLFLNALFFGRHVSLPAAP
ncbi:MAG: zinc carboxypeptidase [Gemmatimonadetes bacterium]|nr:zinc carboxypeptidase [Gemmatimonadota bacterium]